ncbi:hypothetical protein NDU88_002275 [Pleurodeles waltl]|uniref:Endonuclease/exonuclease/phosphatase domain-containing protein n=1 Tax=Pleurodeles waltl TaxID=8319 RepID=A0AAV7NDA4_PLEWA|nr:hypothetical protein NDU88_002275 [Pleurodeles waltl]
MAGTTARTLKVLTWNVTGLGNRIKRIIVLQYLRRHRPDLILLQETHLKGNQYKALNRFGYQLIVHVGYKADSMGVGILQKQSIPFMLTHTWWDTLSAETAGVHPGGSTGTVGEPPTSITDRGRRHESCG